MKKHLFTIACLFIVTFMMAQNPFFEKQWTTPYGTPPFDKIKLEHYLPAVKEGIKQHQTEILSIQNNKQPATFANTIEALENSGQMLTKVSLVLGNLTEAHTNAQLQEINKQVTPLVTAHYDDLYMNENLFKRVKMVYDKKATLKLTPEQSQLLKKTYERFERKGVNLPAEQKTRLKAINARLADLTIQFGDNVLGATNGYYMTVDNRDDLKGLPEPFIEKAAEAAKAKGLSGKWIFGLGKADVLTFEQYAENRDLRRQLYEYYQNRCNGGKWDVNPIITEIVSLRAEQAKIMGFNNYSEYVLDDNMAENPENVFKLLNQLWTPALKMAKTEEADMQKMIDKEGNNFKVQSWDWWYYAEKVRTAKYNLSEEEMKPYFEVSKVREGVFYTCNKLYGINFKKVTNVPVYMKDVDAFEVTDADGSLLGLLYLDYYARPEKRSGAWMTNYREQHYENGKDVRGIISICLNYPAPTATMPSLLTFDEVTTFFHEMGHGLHGLLSKCRYTSLAGTSVSRDFVELPSQILENWASEPEVLKVYAKHYKTGEVIPDALIKKMQAAEKYGQGFSTTEYLAASLLDMDFHTLKYPAAVPNVPNFQQTEMDKIGLIPAIPPRYNAWLFQHIFSGGYASGYYAYIWAEVLDADAFSYFKKNGIFDKKTADSFRKNILERGGTEDSMILYKRFTGGAEPSVQPLIERRGLN